MLHNIKQAGRLKASPMHAVQWLGLALFSLYNNQWKTKKVAKQPISNLLIVLKTFLQTECELYYKPRPTKY